MGKRNGTRETRSRAGLAEDVLERLHHLQLLIVREHAARSTPARDKCNLRARELISLRVAGEVFEGIVADLLARAPAVLFRHEDRRAVQHVLPDLLFVRGGGDDFAAPPSGYSLAELGGDLDAARSERRVSPCMPHPRCELPFPRRPRDFSLSLARPSRLTSHSRKRSTRA